MTALPKLVPSRMTVEEFLDWSGDGSGRKFEFVDGEPRAMAPATIFGCALTAVYEGTRFYRSGES